MDIQWVSTFSLVMLFIHFLFVLLGLFILKKLISIIAASFKVKTNIDIFYPLYGLIAYSLVSALFWQAVSLNIITFSFNNAELYLRSGMGVMQGLFVLWFLVKILKIIKPFKDAGKKDIC